MMILIMAMTITTMVMKVLIKLNEANMKITYISHSGFLIEWENCYWLFDYFKGEIPVMNPDKKLFVFVSHKHEDHYNPDIFHLSKSNKDVQYLLSSDIKLGDKEINKLGLDSDLLNCVHSIKPCGKYECFDQDNNIIAVNTLKSTDCGVAFLLHYQGRTIYHSGDLNLWLWKDETKQYNNNMKANFDKEMKALKDITIDIALVPLDPRQEECYYKGLKGLLDVAKVRYVFPMHYWEQSDIIKQFKKEWPMYSNNTLIMEINQEGQQWDLDT